MCRSTCSPKTSTHSSSNRDTRRVVARRQRRRVSNIPPGPARTGTAASRCRQYRGCRYVCDSAAGQSNATARGTFEATAIRDAHHDLSAAGDHEARITRLVRWQAIPARHRPLRERPVAGVTSRAAVAADVAVSRPVAAQSPGLRRPIRDRRVPSSDESNRLSRHLGSRLRIGRDDPQLEHHHCDRQGPRTYVDAGRCARRNERTWRTASGMRSFGSFHGNMLTSAFGASIAASIATAYGCAGMSSGRINTGV